MIRNPLLTRFIAAGMLVLLGCGDAVAPLPADAAAMIPPAQYALWWTLTETCSGLTGDMSTVKWYTVPTTKSLGTDVNGVYYTSSRRIVLLADSASSPFLVRHEMLHAFIAQPGHPAKYFQDRCAGVVDCNGSCITDPSAKIAAENATQMNTGMTSNHAF